MLSCARRVTLASTTAPALMAPPGSASPAALATGALSPLSSDRSSVVAPSTMTQSAATASPGLIMMT